MLEVHTITGAEDLWCRIVARSNADLQRVIDQVVIVRGIQRASTVIALAEQIPHRVLPLVEAATRRTVGEAFGNFYRGAGYAGADEVAVEFAEDDDADGRFDARDAEDRGGDALGAGLEFAGR